MHTFPLKITERSLCAHGKYAVNISQSINRKRPIRFEKGHFNILFVFFDIFIRKFLSKRTHFTR